MANYCKGQVVVEITTGHLFMIIGFNYPVGPSGGMPTICRLRPAVLKKDGRVEGALTVDGRPQKIVERSEYELKPYKNELE